MARGHQAPHHRHARRQFDWNDIPGSIASALDAPFDSRDQNTVQNGPKTVTQIVYATQAATFSGPTASLFTASDPAVDTATTRYDATTKVTVKPKSTKTAATSTSVAGSITSSSSSSSTDNATGSTEIAKQTSSAAIAASTSTLSQDRTASSGMGSGAKAGVAIGVILIVGAVALLVFFLFRQRKKTAERERLDDEKSDANWDSGAFGGPAVMGAERASSTRTAHTASTAPRLSLRPVTEFLPNLGEKRTSRGNVLQMASGPAPKNAGRAIAPQGQSSWGKPITANSPAKENPFGNHAEAVDPINAAGPTPVEDVTASGVLLPGSGVAAGAAAGAVVTGASLALKRGASKRGNGPKPLDFTTNNVNFHGPAAASPTGTDYSMSEASGAPVQTNSGAAIAAAGGPQNSSVHRVQLDFKPSMEDELELRAGQLIRLLHEYDDGWALCIRLDRSQQGVVPRTCLSTRPVKPRPNPGPNGQQRGGPPPGMRVPGYAQQGRPMSGPNMGHRSQSPVGPQNQGRPMTPTGRHSPSGQQRQDRRITPPGPSRMNPSPPSTSPQQSPGNSPQNSISQPAVGRKPVPGQAM